MSNPSVSIVIPAYNEEAAIGDLLGDCLGQMVACGGPFDITVVNDGSTDGTRAVVGEWMARCPSQIRCVDHVRRQGLAVALDAAYRSGTHECVLLLHADGQYPPDAIAECLRLIADVDAVIMVRRQKFYGPWRAVLSAGYRWLPAVLFGIDLRDPGGAKCIRRELIEQIQPVSSGVFRDPERILRAVRNGKHIAFLPVDIRPRHSGVAQGGRLWLAIQSLIDVSRLWWKTAVRREPW